MDRTQEFRQKRRASSRTSGGGETASLLILRESQSACRGFESSSGMAEPAPERPCAATAGIQNLCRHERRTATTDASDLDAGTDVDAAADAEPPGLGSRCAHFGPTNAEHRLFVEEARVSRQAGLRIAAVRLRPEDSPLQEEEGKGCEGRQRRDLRERQVLDQGQEGHRALLRQKRDGECSGHDLPCSHLEDDRGRLKSADRGQTGAGNAQFAPPHRVVSSHVVPIA